MWNFLNKLKLIFSTFLLVRKGYVAGKKLFFIGIPSNTSEHESFKKHGFYERPMAERFMHDSSTSKVFFDIGGNIGNYSVLYKKVSDGKCYCWEPIQYYRLIHLFNQIINNFSLKNFFLSSKFIGIEDNNEYKNLNTFCQKNEVYPDLVKLDVEGAESVIIPSLEDKFFSNLTLYLEFHVPQIQNDFHKNPYDLLDFLFSKFKNIEFNRNHWGDFKGVSIGNWEIKTKEEISEVITQILDGKSKPRGFALILNN